MAEEIGIRNKQESTHFIGQNPNDVRHGYTICERLRG